MFAVERLADHSRSATPTSRLACRRSARRWDAARSATAELVLDLLADVLRLALGLVGLALGLHAAVAGDAPRNLLDLALRPLRVVLGSVRRGHRWTSSVDAWLL